jgi:hypothetical protein
MVADGQQRAAVILHQGEKKLLLFWADLEPV